MSGRRSSILSIEGIARLVTTNLVEMYELFDMRRKHARSIEEAQDFQYRLENAFRNIEDKLKELKSEI